MWRTSQIVAAYVVGRVGEVLAEADHRGLVADGVDAPQGVGDGRSVTGVRVPPVHPGRDPRHGAVGGGQLRVEDAHRVPGAGESGDGVRADEPRRLR